MVVAVRKYAAAAAMIFVCGCNADLAKQPLSERFNVCANLPAESIYRHHDERIDFDTGVLEIDGVAVDVQIGGHPRFSQRVKREGVYAIEGFRFLGKETSDERDKVLLGHERRDGLGPMFVMFTAPDLQKVEHLLTHKNLVVDCKD